MGFANRKKQRVKVETLRNCVVTGFIKLPEITKDYVEVDLRHMNQTKQSNKIKKETRNMRFELYDRPDI